MDDIKYCPLCGEDLIHGRMNHCIGQLSIGNKTIDIDCEATKKHIFFNPI